MSTLMFEKTRPILFVSLLLSILIRVFVIYKGYGDYLTKSYEIVTPLTSFTRLKEGIWFFQNGLSPFSGSYYHNSPLFLYLFENNQYTHIIFIAVDVFAAILIFLMPSHYYRLFKKEQIDAEQYNREHKPDKMLWTISKRLPEIMAAIYLFNPLTIATCCSYSLQCIENFVVILTIYLALSQWWFTSSILLGLCVHLSPYYAVLTVPFALIYARFNQKSVPFNIFATFTLVIISNLGLLILSFGIVNKSWDSLDIMNLENWSFLLKTYGFTYSVQDTQPNIGIFWYFFTSLFDNYIVFYAFVVQYHVFIYTIPVSYSFKKYPFVALWILLAIIGTFKTYPSVGDIALFISLLPLILHLLQEMIYGFAISVASICIIVLAPVMWRMWVWTGTGNANFYFAICLVTVFAEALLITDAATAVLKRDFLLASKKFKAQ